MRRSAENPMYYGSSWSSNNNTNPPSPYVFSTVGRNWVNHDVVRGNGGNVVNFYFNSSSTVNVNFSSGSYVSSYFQEALSGPSTFNQLRQHQQIQSGEISSHFQSACQFGQTLSPFSQIRHQFGQVATQFDSASYPIRQAPIGQPFTQFEQFRSVFGQTLQLQPSQPVCRCHSKRFRSKSIMSSFKSNHTEEVSSVGLDCFEHSAKPTSQPEPDPEEPVESVKEKNPDYNDSDFDDHPSFLQDIFDWNYTHLSEKDKEELHAGKYFPTDEDIMEEERRDAEIHMRVFGTPTVPGTDAADNVFQASEEKINSEAGTAPCSSTTEDTAGEDGQRSRTYLPRKAKQSATKRD